MFKVSMNEIGGGGDIGSEGTVAGTKIIIQHDKNEDTNLVTPIVSGILFLFFLIFTVSGGYLYKKWMNRMLAWSE